MARRNVERSLEAGRLVQILYVYQEPMLAWGFVQAREAAEGRRIEPSTFVKRVYAVVLKKATERQNQVEAKAAAAR